MSNEKPGGHGERSVAVGTIDMAVWDAVAKIAGKPLFRLLAERHGRSANPRVFVYAAGGYYYPGKGLSTLRGEMRGYLDRGYNVVKMKIGGAPIEEDRERIEAVLEEIGSEAQLAVDANGRFDLETAIAYAKMLRDYPLFWYEEAGDPLDFSAAGGAGGILSRADGDRRKPVQPSGRAQSASAMAGCGPTATGCNSIARCPTAYANISARSAVLEDARLVAEPLHPAWRASDVAQHRRRPRSRRQRELSRPVPALWRFPRRRPRRERPHHHAGSAGHRLRGEVRSLRGDEGAGGLGLVIAEVAASHRRLQHRRQDRC